MNEDNLGLADVLNLVENGEIITVYKPNKKEWMDDLKTRRVK